MIIAGSIPPPCSGSEAVCSFWTEAVQLLLRRPHELFELQQQLLGDAAGGGAVQFSLLAPCVLRQLLRVLPSGKIPAADKAAATAYVAAVLRQLAEQQLGSGGGTTHLAALLLGVVRHEAARQQQQANGSEQPHEQAGGKADKKRKHAPDGAAAAPGGGALLLLPPEGRPLVELLAWLEQQVSGAQQPQKKKSKGSSKGAVAATCEVAALAQPEAVAMDTLPAPDACCRLISQLAASGSADLLADVQRQLVAAAPPSGSSGVGTCSAAARQCLSLLECGPSISAKPALLQALRSAVLSAAGDAQARCLLLLARSSQVAAALAAGADASEEQQAVLAILAQLLQTAGGRGGALLQQVGAAFEAAVQAGGDGEPAVAGAFLLLLPHMSSPAVDTAAGALFARLAPGSDNAGGGGSSGKKSKKRAAAAGDAAGSMQPWLAEAAAAVLAQLVQRGSLEQQPPQLQQACGLVLQLGAMPQSAAAACSCLQELLSCKRLRGPALTALGGTGRQQLLRCCLAVGGSVEARGRAAALLVENCGDCRHLAAELLPGLLGGGPSDGFSSLALVLPAAAALLRWQQPESKEAADQLAAALHQDLLAWFAAGGSQPQQRPARKQQVGATPAAAVDEATAEQLRQHALACLRLALQRQPLDSKLRQQVLATLLPQQGWEVSSTSGGSLQPGVEEQAEAAMLVLTAGGAPPARELAACVRCFAATLPALLK